MPYDQQAEVRNLQTLARKVENKYHNRWYLTKGYSGGSNNIRQINKLDSFRRKTASRSARKEKRSVLHPKTSEHALHVELHLRKYRHARLFNQIISINLII